MCSDVVNENRYFIWSLLDDFEWASGYSVFGIIIYINYIDNFARYPKDSAIWLLNSFHKKNTEFPVIKRSFGEEDHHHHEQVSNKKSRKWN